MIVLVMVFTLFLCAADLRADIYKSVTEDGVVCFTNTPTDRGSHIVLKENKPAKTTGKNKETGHVRNTPYHSLAEEKARQHNLDPALVKAVIKAESNWNPHAVSPKGARGLMQLMPSTASDLGVGDVFDPEKNIDGGVRYLKYLLEKFNGNLTLALAAYNAGPKRVEKTNTVPQIPETLQYVRRVMNTYSGGTDAPATLATEPKVAITRIKKIVLDDGTVLYTNAQIPSPSLAN